MTPCRIVGLENAKISPANATAANNRTGNSLHASATPRIASENTAIPTNGFECVNKLWRNIPSTDAGLRLNSLCTEYGTGSSHVNSWLALTQRTDPCA